eukprot:8510126-Pyramimonas_sp.AAC.1
MTSSSGSCSQVIHVLLGAVASALLGVHEPPDQHAVDCIQRLSATLPPASPATALSVALLHTQGAGRVLVVVPARMQLADCAAVGV